MKLGLQLCGVIVGENVGELWSIVGKRKLSWLESENLTLWAMWARKYKVRYDKLYVILYS